MALKEKIAAGPVVPRRTIDLPGAQVAVECRGFTGTGREKFRQFFQAQQASGGDEVDQSAYYPMVLIGQVFDPTTGAPEFVAGDEATVGQLAAQDLELMTRAVLELSALDDKAEARARGNSNTASVDSTSPSPNA